MAAPRMAAPRIASWVAASTALPHTAPAAPARKQTSEKYSEIHRGTVSHPDDYMNQEAMSHQSS
jgi:hypothetical protein